MTINDLLKNLDREFNFDNQEEWDHCGANLFSINLQANITGVYVCLDITFDNIKNAIDNNCNVIISHHPLFIGDQNELNPKTISMIAEIQKQISNNNLCHIVLHTCYDRFKYGTAYQIFKKINSIEFEQIEFKLVENSKYAYYYELNDEITLDLFLQLLSNKSIFNTIKTFKKNIKKNIKTIAIAPGSGMSEYFNVLNNPVKIDCFLTGDVKWHNFIEASMENICLVDIGHDAEKVFICNIYEILKSLNVENINKDETVDYFSIYQ